MKIVYISTYAPRECGIATFTNDLLNAVLVTGSADLISQDVVAITDQKESYLYPDEVKFSIQQDNQHDYIQAANFINSEQYDCCVLEHEFGIFGGVSGLYILSLIKQIHIPLIVNFHTILEKPSTDEKAILIEIAKRASKIVVMTQHAIGILSRVYQIPVEKIVCIPHGVPTYSKSQQQAKADLQLAHKKIILTFGFIGRNKGIETVIKALPAVVRSNPEVVYLIVGKTHPNVLRHSGEEYREFLQQLTEDLKLTDYVQFVNDFVDIDLLSTYLSACDIYVTPYINEAQITSGTLSYAIGAGAAVLSTPYWHAVELLGEGRGVLFPFKDAITLGVELKKLLNSPAELIDQRARALEFGKNMTWTKLGENYLSLIREASLNYSFDSTKHLELAIADLPPFSLAHIRRLTNQVGIIQHATYSIPNYKEGYCLDDNARALLISLMAYEEFEDAHALELMPTYLAYIHYAQRPDGLFHNFMNYGNEFLDDIGSEDSFGRTIWALGYLFKASPLTSYYQLGQEMFFRASTNFENLRSIRAIAYVIMGISHYLEHQPNDENMIERMRVLSNKLVHEYKVSSNSNWEWFEPVLAYDNAILPLSLLQASKFLNDEELNFMVLKTMRFLEEIIFQNGYLSIVGNQDWYRQNQLISKFGQQPIDVTATVLMFYEAYKLTNDAQYLEKMTRSFQWFLGENDLKLALYDAETKGSCDGLESYGINRNQGAESTICYLISYLTVHKALK
ncbi:glycosyltransferase family 4 protein [Sphingobacteriaceae bacterium WQ 2009]|uniref:Glycosyltransferase family 4 protein n=1 Tax=Rhinopithecimicrobium faecis TaxID=2820698 RepID=A0A8T4HFM2_9SPHI|nr:glycosyltransferase family 4 protein [Sphingobacteriaceae bacterium WQ 2009]